MNQRGIRCLVYGLRFILGGVLLLTPTKSNAQNALDSKGTEFILAFPENNNTPDQLSLFITGEQNTTGTVEIPGLTFQTNFTVTAGMVTTVTLPLDTVLSSSDTVENKGIIVQAQNEVTIYGFNRRNATTDAYLGLPTDILGTDYIVLAFVNVGVVNGTLFAVVGTQNDTTVTITPSATTGTRQIGVPFNITLNRGQTYLLKNTINGNDLTGTIITSDKPIAVFGGHKCANVPTASVTACDHLVEQLPPTNTWGREFVTMPLATRQNGDTFRFLASTNETNVSVNGTMVATLNRGEFHQQLITAPSRITSDQPILVAQYSNGTSFDGVTSDPFMMLIPPFEQFLGAYTVTTPSEGISINFINIVAPDAAVGTVTLDGSPIASSSFQTITGSGFSGAQISVNLGSHTLNSPFPFGVFVYGFDQADSYGYPGGMSLSAVVSVTNITLTPNATNLVSGAQHCVNATVTDQNTNPLESIRVDFTVTGANPTSGFVLTNANGIAQFCFTSANAGTDTILAEVGSLSTTATATFKTVLISAVVPNRAPASGGTKMTIIGNGLDIIDNFSVGGVAVNDLSIVDANSATFTAPPRPEGPVDLNTNNGQASVTLLSKAFRYVGQVQRSVRIVQGSQADDYRMIGLPLAGSQSTKSLLEQFQDQLDFSDPSIARIFRFNGTTYDEGTAIPNLSTGAGFWIISSQGIDVNLNGGDSNQFVLENDGTVSPDPPVTVFIHPGWNQVSPSISGAMVSPQNTSVTNGELLFTVTDTQNTLTNHEFFEFTGDVNTPYKAATVLDGEGSYWLFNATNNSIILSFGKPQSGNNVAGVTNLLSSAVENFLKSDISTTAIPASIKLAMTGNTQGILRAVTHAESSISPPSPPAGLTSTTTSSDGGGGSGGGCFIATAAYGSPLDQRIHSLTVFRDKKLIPTELGHALTATYYANSPIAAKSLKSHPAFRALARKLLRPLVERVQNSQTLEP